MAHVVSVSIEGLAGRKEILEIDLNRKLNIFYGLNGSGKTSLLKIIHSAMQKDAFSLINVPFENAEVKIYSILDDKEYTYQINKSKLAKYKKFIIQSSSSDRRTIRSSVLARLEEDNVKWEETPKRERKSSVDKWQHRYLPTSRLFERSLSSVTSGGINHLEESDLDSHFIKLIEMMWSEYFAGVLSEIRKIQENGLSDIIAAILLSISDENSNKKFDGKISYELAYHSLRRFLNRRNLEKAIGDINQFKSKFESDKFLQKISYDAYEIEVSIDKLLEPKNKLQELIKKLFNGNKSIVFEDRLIRVKSEKEEEISLELLSSGEKQLIRILIEAIISGKNSLIIDEPEISLHIDWQMRLVNDLNTINDQMQVIIATHSPEIMANVEDHLIFRI
jgi:predicted ATPase